MKQFAIMAITALLIAGCSAPLPSTVGSIAATPVTTPMVGTWCAEDEVVLGVARIGDQIQLSMAPDSDWRIDILDAQASNESVKFIQRFFSHDGRSSLENQTERNTTLKLLDDDHLKITTATPDTPEGESRVLTRRK